MSNQVKLSCEVVETGNRYQDFLNEGILLIFPAETVMTQIKNYSLMVSDIKLYKEIKLGDLLIIGEKQFIITDVGVLVNQNIEEIGHFTIKVESDEATKLPGTLYIEPSTLPRILVGEKIMIKGE